MKVPKTASTRLIIPQTASGTEPANADPGTMSFDPALGVLRVKLVGGWVDVGGGGGGSVTSITTGTPGVVTITNPTGPAVNIDVTAPTAPITSLAAGPGIAITSPGGPVPTISTQFSYARNPILEPPISPNAFDDEFADGSEDLLARGWTLWNDSAGVLITTRVGDVDITNFTLSDTQYRSSLKGSVMYVQWPNTSTFSITSVHMYKAASGPARFGARVSRSFGDATTNKGWTIVLATQSANPFYTPNGVQFRALGLTTGSGGAGRPALVHDGITAGVTVHYGGGTTQIDGSLGTWGNNIQRPYWTPDVFTIDTGGSLPVPDLASAWNSATLEALPYQNAEGSVAAAYTRMILAFEYRRTQNAVGQSNSIYAIDFVRKMPVYSHWSTV